MLATLSTGTQQPATRELAPARQSAPDPTRQLADALTGVRCPARAPNNGGRTAASWGRSQPAPLASRSSRGRPDGSVTRFHFLNQFPKVKTTRFIAKNIYKIFNNISARFTLPAILKSGQPRAGSSRQFREMTCFGAKSQERRCSWRSQRPANNIHEHY